MGRGRLNLQLLQSQKARRKAYETRKRGLEKKANELSTLCGVDVCLIMYPPPLKNEEIEPYVWSNKPDQVENLIESHKLSRSGDGYFFRSKTYNLSSFYKDQTRKVEEEIEKVKKTIREVKYPNWDQQYDSFSVEELRMFARVLTAKVESTKETIESFKEKKAEVPESSFLINIPRFDEIPDSSLGRKLAQHQFPTYFDVQSYLENQRRTMMINNVASFSGNNPYDHDVMNFAPLMSYDMQIVANSVPGYGQELMISPGCYPQLYSGFHPSLGLF
ncbi:agamous-like MADS-box protein AGL92 [Primulina huaijiensis]|uniref:agamous-like MADS-box protein AGL92 n=1 Tax=Primulina huaijiensis TaxID=1492673 RepID=UPI003CC765B1